jgi:hypothetical protein
MFVQLQSSQRLRKSALFHLLLILELTIVRVGHMFQYNFRLGEEMVERRGCTMNSHHKPVYTDCLTIGRVIVASRGISVIAAFGKLGQIRASFCSQRTSHLCGKYVPCTCLCLKILAYRRNIYL